jgi:hypothetical protein
VYSAVPNLGLLVTMDYDSGEVLRTDYVGLGMRSVTFDRERGRVYLTHFLGGEVVAIDVDTGEELRRWSVGRFPRFATIVDGHALYVGTNLGIVAIELGRR